MPTKPNESTPRLPLWLRNMIKHVAENEPIEVGSAPGSRDLTPTSLDLIRQLEEMGLVKSDRLSSVRRIVETTEKGQICYQSLSEE